MNPTKMMERLNEIDEAWSDLGSVDKFADMSSPDFTTEINKSRTVRDELNEIEAQFKQKLMEREAIDAANWKLAQLIVLSVAGSPKYGKNSALYARMGYVPTSERDSGLTRKKKDNGDDNQ
jgi:hypothetical protein